LMNVGGDPFVIEYNVRMGDPETEVVMPRIESDIIDLFEGVVFGSLDKKDIKFSDKTAVTVMCVSGGYPENYEKGLEIKGLGNKFDNSIIYHAGTKVEEDVVLTSGGRVLSVTSMGDTIQEALDYSYDTISKIYYDKMFYRKDIGQDLLKF